MRVAKKPVTGLREILGRNKLVLTLDEHEYRLVLTHFLEYLLHGIVRKHSGGI